MSAAGPVPTPSSRLRAVATGPEGAPVVVLAGAVGTDHRLWDSQVAALAGPLRVVAYDHPGHGESPAPPAGARLDDLGRQLLALLDDVGAPHAHLVGLSLGGLVVQWAAAHAPDRVASVALLCTDAALPPAQRWTERAAAVRADGTASLVPGTPARWFAPGVAPPAAGLAQLAALAGCDDEGYARCCEVLAHADLHDRLPDVVAPALVVAGAQDQALPVGRLAALAEALPDGRLAVLEGCGHLPPVEAPDAVSALLRGHVLGGAA